jgi:hypothetical protein
MSHNLQYVNHKTVTEKQENYMKAAPQSRA